MINNMKRIGIYSFVVLLVLFSCQTVAEPVQPKVPDPVVSQQPPETTNGGPVQVFNPSSISQEEKDTTKVEIQQLIQRLNSIIRAKNYNSWVSYLDPEYFAVINSKEFLDNVSQFAVLAQQNIVLKSAQDYFNYVVVPSHANDRVDDIEFESQNRVKAYTVNNKGETLRLYDLERNGNEWKIIN